MRHKLMGFVVLACALAASGCQKEVSPTPDPTTEFHGTWRTVSPTKKEYAVLIKFEEETLYLMDLGGRSTGSSESTSVGGAGGLQRGEKDRYAIIAKQNYIDVIATEGPHEGKTRQGLYAFEGAQLKICLGGYGQERPSAISGDPRYTLWVLERKK